jgi:predicted MFS family arabinose efflux permease
VVAWGAGPIVAPYIGGLFQQYLSWTSSFYFMAAYGALVVALVHFMLPETNQKRISRFSQSFKNIAVILKEPKFTAAAVCAGICLSTLYVFNIFSAYLMIEELGYSPVEYGQVLLFVGSSWLLGSLFNRAPIKQGNTLMRMVGAPSRREC